MNLEELKNLLSPAYALLGLILFVLLVICLVLFFEYYDKSMRIKQKNDDEHIKEIVDKKLKESEKN